MNNEQALKVKAPLLVLLSFLGTSLGITVTGVAVAGPPPTRNAQIRPSAAPRSQLKGPVANAYNLRNSQPTSSTVGGNARAGWDVARNTTKGSPKVGGNAAAGWDVAKNTPTGSSKAGGNAAAGWDVAKNKPQKSPKAGGNVGAGWDISKNQPQ